MGAKGEKLTPADAAWLRMDARENPADIAALLVLEGKPDEALLFEALERRLLSERRFRSRIVEPGLGLPRWSPEPDFDLSRHFERRALPAPEGFEQLADLVGEILSEPLDRSRSPWGIHLVDLPGGSSALVARVHHAIGDGFALVDHLLSIADEPPPRPVIAPRPAPGLLARAAMDALALARLVALPFDSESALRGKASGRRRVAWSRGVALEQVKRIARARGAKVNDVLAAALAGALRSYLLDARNELPRPLRAIVPVNLRPASELLDSVRGNHFGVVLLELPLEEAEPGARLDAVRTSMARLKASEEAPVSLALLELLGLLPGPLGRIADFVFARKASLVFTNVPGPRSALAIAGRKVQELVFWAPHPSGLALGASVLSYAGTVRLGIRSDAAVVPDPASVARAFDAELDTLARNVLLRPSAPLGASSPQP